MTEEERFEFLKQSIESHDRKLGEITGKLADLTEKQDLLTARFDVLDRMMIRLLGAMKALAEAAMTK